MPNIHNGSNYPPPGGGGTHNLKPDLLQTARFIEAIDTTPSAPFGFRTFDDRGSDIRCAVKLHGTLGSAVRQSANPTKNGRICNPLGLLGFMQRLGAGVFFVANLLNGAGQRAANVVGIRALYVDCDTRDTVERLRRFIAATGLVPTIVVASGGVHDGVDKLHAYWRVTGCAVEDFTRSQLMLISRIGSDSAVQDPSRVMRLPGFYHQKHEPRMTCIIESSGRVYDCAELVALTALHPPFCHPAPGKQGNATSRDVASSQPINKPETTSRLRVLLDQHNGNIAPAATALIREAYRPNGGAPGNRHPTLVSIAGRCVQAGWHDELIRKLVIPVATEAWQVEGLSEDLNSILRSLRAKEAAKLAAAPPMSERAKRAASAFGCGQVGAR
jgi:hypothetical protein